MRISRTQMFMEQARTASKRSTCCRLNVGAVVTHENTPVSSGYNGPASGEVHCQGNSCPLTPSGGCSRSLHAEANALDRLSNEHLSHPLDLYVTHSPCPKCCELIKRYPVKRIFFEAEYRDTTALKQLIEHGIQVYRVTPSGYTINLATNEILSE